MSFVDTVKSVLAKLQASPNYPDRKVILGAVTGAVTAVVAAVGLAASPLVAAGAAVVITTVTAFLAKPALRDVRRRVSRRGSVRG